MEKILKAKYWAGLHTYQPVDLENLEEELNTVQDSLLHATLVENSITLLQNKNDIFPIKELTDTKIAYVKLGDAPHEDFVEMLQKYTTIEEVEVDSSAAFLERLSDYDRIIVGFHKSNSNPWKSYKFTNDELVLLEEISKKNSTILSVFASPYSLLQIDSFDAIEAVLVGYQNSKTAQKFYRKSESFCESALEILQEIDHADSSIIHIWLDRGLDFEADGGLGLTPAAMPRLVTSRSLEKQRSDTRLRSKRNIKIAVVEMAINKLLEVKTRHTGDKQKLAEFIKLLDTDDTN